MTVLLSFSMFGKSDDLIVARIWLAGSGSFSDRELSEEDIFEAAALDIGFSSWELQATSGIAIHIKMGIIECQSDNI